jgi:putative flippase GtrA
MRRWLSGAELTTTQGGDVAGTTLVDLTTADRSTGACSESSARSLARKLFDDKRIRFVLAGGLNTGFGFACFVAYQHTVGAHWGYMWTLALTHCTSVLFAFATHRAFVFQVSGALLLDLWRFESVYLAALGLNAVLLPLLVELGSVPVLAAQAAITCLNVIVSWLGHSRFSFRRSSAPS